MENPVAIQPNRGDNRKSREVSEPIIRKGNTEPYKRKTKAELGAMGMPPGQKVVSQWMDTIQPTRASRPKPAAKDERNHESLPRK
ncbi:MAG: hypothetical protein A2X81_16660 [Desulfobacterales bacterium GWB2_56_26]|nr:MAG: hypothetical protein A2X81_16660 [Desulfobacterales bacterium GWB2_56_26]